MNRWKVGDVVRLKSGSPWMTVNTIENEKTVSCVWVQNGRLCDADMISSDALCEEGMIANEDGFFPCPSCDSDAVDLHEDPAAGACDGGGEVWVECSECQVRGPATRLGCREEEEEEHGPINLEEEARDNWNAMPRRRPEFTS